MSMTSLRSRISPTLRTKPSAPRGRAPMRPAACVFCAAALAAAAVVAALAPAPSRAETAAEDLVHANALSKAFRRAAELASPAVVVVRSEAKPKALEGRGRQRRGDNPFKGTPFEGMFPDGLPEGFEFNLPEGQSPGRSGVGSGVIVDAEGVVITNNHVVEGADEVTVELSDGRTFKASSIETDPESDLAVVKLADASDLPTAKLGDSDKLEIGDWVIAIGNPFDLETTVSAGIISGKGRELGGIRRAQFLQTDAAINPGNSGGPLINLEGDVVGINTAIASNSGGYQGIGFAIPANLARWVTDQLISKGTVERAYIGVQMGPLDTRMAAKLGIKDRNGALVNDVVPGSPAAAAGVQELDVITAFDGKPVKTTRSLQEIVERSAIGKPHSLTVVRDGEQLTLTITVKPLPGDLAQSGRRVKPEAEAAENEGETFYSADFGIEVRDKASLPSDPYSDFDGVVVDRVDADGVAAAAGLGPGVLIRKVGRTPVASIAEFEAALAAESAADGVVLGVRTPRGNSVVLLKKD